MVRLIDANELKNKFQYLRKMWSETEIVLTIEDAKTVDAVEVVRCKDCKFWLDSWLAPDGKTTHGYCHLEEADDVIVGRWDDDFCPYGERKDNES